MASQSVLPAHGDDVETVVPQGPWGGNGGSVFYDGRSDKIKQIDVVYDAAIISLSVKYDLGTHTFSSSLHGGAGGAQGPQGKSTSVVFQGDEYLAQVTGTYGSAYGGLTLVTSLSFVSNKRVYGPYGPSSGTSFKSSSGNQIRGFYGHSGWLLDQIGVFLDTSPPLPVVLSGGFGGEGGSPWYEGRGEISGITLKYAPGGVIGQIQVTYLQGDKKFVAPLHGGNPLSATATISINFPDEYLLEVKGTHGEGYGVKDLVLSLQFITNKKTYGPYGNSSAGTPFASARAGRIVGLYGRSGDLLDQISAIVAPFREPL